MSRWRRLFRYLPPHRRALWLGFGALLAGNVFMVLVPVAFKQGIDVIETSWRTKTALAWGGVLAWVGAGIGLSALSGASGFCKRWLLMGTSRRIATTFRRDLFAHIQRLPRPYFDRVRTGDLMSRATADVEAVRMAGGPAMMYLADSILRLPLALAVMLLHSPLLTAFAVLPLLMIALGLWLLAPRLHRASRRVQDLLAEISARSQENFSGIRVVKSFALEPAEESSMADLSRSYLEAHLRLSRLRGATSALVTGMGALAMALILFVGGEMVIEGTFEIGALLMFQFFQGILTWPMMTYGWVLSLVQRGAAGLDRINEVLDRPAEHSAAANGSPPARGALEFRDLTFRYDEADVLRNISLTVPAGTTLGVVGVTGAGKSSLIRLLPRLYDPPPGTVFLDGRDVLEIPLAELRERVAMVPQEAFLFSRTIEENVRFGREGATEAELDAAIRAARLDRDLEQFPRGAQTPIGERGVTLSGGQKQRATLARALLADAPVLILDDSLSAVDAETEAVILENLKEVRAQRTVILVSHRVSAVRDADRIVYLRDGQVEEEGTHQELLDRGGEYARLAHAQALQAEIEAMSGPAAADGGDA